MRVRRTDGTLLGASDVVPVAERLGLVRFLDHRVLELVVSELATNAMRHAGSAFVVGVSATAGETRLWVRDASSSVPVPHQPDPLAERGRGLALVDAIASRWGHDAVDGGKVVWAALRGEAPPAVAPSGSPPTGK